MSEEDGQLTYSPTPIQSDFMRSTAFVRVLAGAIGSGKSVTCAHELVRWATEQVPNKKGVRRTRFLIVRNTLDQLKQTTLKTIFDWIPPAWAGTWVAQDKTFYIRFSLPDGTIVETDWLAMPLDTPDDVRKALSLELTGLWGNESREIHSEVADALLGRVDRYPSAKDGGVTRAGAIFDTNMPLHGSWWHDKMAHPPANWQVFIQPPAIMTKAEFLAKYEKKSVIFDLAPFYKIYTHFDHRANEVIVEAKRSQNEGQSFTTVNLVVNSQKHEAYIVNPEADNLVNLSPTYYTNIVTDKTTEYVDVFLRCKYGMTKAGKPVFDAFRQDFHVSTSVTPIRDANYPIIIGMDFGLTPACTFSQLDPRGRLLTFAEITSTNTAAVQFIENKLRPMLASRFAGFPLIVIGDPAGVQRSQTDAKSAFDIFEYYGFSIIPAPTNNIVKRIAAMETMLTRVIDGAAAHLIHPGCTKLIGGLSGGYKFNIRKDGEMDSKPLKNSYSHVVDAHGYGVLYALEGSDAAAVAGRRKSDARPVKTSPKMQSWV